MSQGTFAHIVLDTWEVGRVHGVLCYPHQDSDRMHESGHFRTHSSGYLGCIYLYVALG